MRKWIIYIFLPLIQCAQLNEQMSLSNWQFKNNNSKQWHQAKVPGNIYNDLLETKQIPDPYFTSNEKKVQWVDTCDWDYATEFNLEETKLKKFEQAEIQFNRLETFATVILNDSVILKTNNAFRTWKKNIHHLLRPGKNKLNIHFVSTTKVAKQLSKQLPYTLPGDEKVFVRAPHYKFGWDFGPRFVGCGITAPVTIHFWNTIKLETVSVVQVALTSKKADLNFTYKIQSSKNQEVKLEIINTNTGKKEIRTVSLQNGENFIEQNCVVPDPQLWWCNGYGKPYLYSFAIKIILPNGQTITQTKKFGIRKIELIQKEDPFGKSFYFQLNGVPIFIKGANMIPSDIIKQNRKDFEFPSIAKNNHMNMLRVWGGGTYCTDDFYNTCDELGVLVWQDLMFACAMYPADTVFKNNVTTEITEQAMRLNNHACLALWCGNNEVDEGWNNWGWQKEFKYSKKDSAIIYTNYLDLFDAHIPKILKTHSPSVSYWSTSPSVGWGHKESLLQGDSHYWGVWWGIEPFENYETKFGRFMSEYGFQSLPSYNTIKKLSETDSSFKLTSSITSHQKNTRGFETIDTYLKRAYKQPTNFEKYIYATQLVQRDGMQMAIETHRRNKPYCMGTLFWQLNDCWPGISWSASDYFNEPKAFMYELKNLYQTVLISVHKERDNYSVYVINDSINKLKGKLSIQIKDFSNRLISNKTVTVDLKANSSEIHYAIKDADLKELNLKMCYLICRFESEDGSTLSENFYFFNKPKDLQLNQPKINMSLSSDGKCIQVSANTFVKDLYLYSNKTESIFKNNFLNLEAGVTYKIYLNKKTTDLKCINYFTVNNLSQPNE